MQIVPGNGLLPLTPNTSPVVVAAGPTAPAAPIEPARRVTAGREGARSDLMAQRPRNAAQTRGRLIDLLV